MQVRCMHFCMCFGDVICVHRLFTAWTRSLLQGRRKAQLDDSDAEFQPDDSHEADAASTAGEESDADEAAPRRQRTRGRQRLRRASGTPAAAAGAAGAAAAAGGGGDDAMEEGSDDDSWPGGASAGPSTGPSTGRTTRQVRHCESRPTVFIQLHHDAAGTLQYK